MPTYTVETQTGQTYRITADSPEAAVAQVENRFESLAQETGFGQSALISAGRGLTELGRGLGELVGIPAQRDPIEEASYAALQRERPVATALGESAPFVAGGVGAGLATRGIPALAGLLPGMGVQGTTAGAIGAAMPGTAGERAMRGAVEAVTGAVGEAGGRAVSGLAGLGIERAAPFVQRQVENARRLGYRVLPTTGTESRILRNVVEGGLEATPGGALELDKVATQNQDLLNRHAAQAIGETADDVSSETLRNARARIGQTFDRVMSEDRTILIDDALLGRVIEIDEDNIRPLIAGAPDAERALARTYKMLEAGEITARELQAQQSKIGKVARAALRGENSNPELAHSLFDLQDALLDAAGRYLPAEDLRAFHRARQQYRTLSALESGQNVDPVTGTVHAGRLANFLQRRDRAGFMEGRDTSPLYEGVRFMARQQPPLKSSGTAERSWMRELLKTGVIGAGAGGATGQDVESAGLGALGGVGAAVFAPNLATRMYLAPAASQWLTRTASPITQGLARGGGLTAAQTLMGPEEISLLGP